MTQVIEIQPGTRVRLRDFYPGDTSLCEEKSAARRKIERHVGRMAELQHILFADAGHALLIVLQGMDASGKDGVIRHVMSGLNPLGCRAVSYKAPTPEERAHDFLWRVHREVPARGWSGIFNRSHYEDVVAARVRRLVPPNVWRRRYEPINQFERLLADNRRNAWRSASRIQATPGRSIRWIGRTAGVGTSSWPRTRRRSPAAARPGRRGTSSRPTTSGTAIFWCPNGSSRRSRG